MTTPRRGRLGFDAAKAGRSTAHTALVISSPCRLDRRQILGLRRSVFVGSVVITVGNVALAIPNTAASIRLFCMVVGPACSSRT
jgi:hypothetical protein